LAQDLREFVIRPTLRRIDLWSEAAENLLMGTAAQESMMGRNLRQVNGPAIGIFGMEPDTHNDIWSNYLVFRVELMKAVLKFTVPNSMRVEQLAWNLRYAAAMCRIHYLRVPDPLPDHNDPAALGCYWKNHYNTHLGKGTVEDFVRSYAAMVI